MEADPCPRSEERKVRLIKLPLWALPCIPFAYWQARDRDCRCESGTHFLGSNPDGPHSYAVTSGHLGAHNGQPQFEDGSVFRVDLKASL